MYVLTVEFEIQPQHSAGFMRAMVANARASREREPGCRQFDVCVAPDDPRRVFLYEVYDDRAAFDAHVASDHFKAFNAAVTPLVAGRTLRVYDRVDP